MSAALALLAALLLALPVTLETGALRVERVFGPEVPTGPYKHPASITELANGDLYLSIMVARASTPRTPEFSARV